MANAGPTLLYVEDEESDRLLMQRACAKVGIEALLRMVNHGQAAIDYLSGNVVYADRIKYPSPTVVLLDLNLPEVHGFDVLKWIRSHPAYTSLPVVVFTSSPRDEDRNRALQLGANDFLQKPNLPSSFQHVVRQVHERWLVRASNGPDMDSAGQ